MSASAVTPLTAGEYLHISIATQQLTLWRNHRAQQQFPISSAARGCGQQRHSQCTPSGWHRIRIAIGANAPLNAVFVGRRCTGEIYTPTLRLQYPQRDWILTRILWLSGCEPGHNRYGAVDSLSRYIYIHGTPDEEPMMEPHSHGCIRMRNHDVIALFSQVSRGMGVYIDAG
ncbi:MAG: L,D-transpeptidase [Gammaproteobacteria bacterium]|nr:L,D-transpeptidase [Gammaproteobacteria bacterium]